MPVWLCCILGAIGVVESTAVALSESVKLLKTNTCLITLIIHKLLRLDTAYKKPGHKNSRI